MKGRWRGLMTLFLGSQVVTQAGACSGMVVALSKERPPPSRSAPPPPITRRHMIRESAAAVASLSILASSPASSHSLPAPAHLAAAKPSQDKKEEDEAVDEIFNRAVRKALGGGVSGAGASVVSVLSLMWMRTVMNYQYRNGTSTREALETLLAQGGVPRLYEGLPFALLQGPLSRFGDVAANDVCLLLLSQGDFAVNLPLPITSAAGSLAAALWRIFLMPIDALKTVSQINGSSGIPLLWDKISAEGVGALYEGSLAVCVATWVGHYPWFLTFNYLDSTIPLPHAEQVVLTLARNACIGCVSTCVSDTCSNSIRVIKSVKQSSPAGITYAEAVRMVVDEDGILGLFWRGLGTRLAVNALQGAMFSVLWRYLEKLLVH